VTSIPSRHGPGVTGARKDAASKIVLTQAPLIRRCLSESEPGSLRQQVRTIATINFFLVGPTHLMRRVFVDAAGPLSATSPSLVD